MKSSPRSSLILPALFMGLGGLCMIGGIVLLVARLTNPEKAAQILPVTQAPLEPTEGILLKTALPPPPRPRDEAIPIMPVMEVGVVQLPETAIPSQTPSATAAPSLTSTATFQAQPPTLTNTPTPRLAGGTPIPFITPTATITSTATPTLTPTATRIPRQPTRLLIPAIDLDAPIQKVWLQQIVVDGQLFSQWRVPDGRAIGWHESSAPLGQVGNTVFNGHHNIEGHVFRDLIDVQVGDTVRIEAADNFGIDYTVVQTMLLPEEGQPVEVRLENARWLLPSNDERITLVTCWPPDGRTHRLVVVALPSASLNLLRGN